MFRNYLSIFVRNLFKQKGFSVINIFGLALGLTCFTVITVYIGYETGFDQFHPRFGDLYRLNKIVATSDGAEERHALTAGLLAPALEEAFPEVEAATRVQPWFDEILMSHEDLSITSPDVAIVDRDFFDVFGFELVRGDLATVLENPLSIVLTASVAESLFGSEDPMGQTVQALGNLEYVVTGIAADPNPRSHLRFTALISWSSTLPGAGGLEFGFLNTWITQAPFTYVRLVRDTDPTFFQSKLPAFYQANDPERADRYVLYVQPIQETYLHSAELLYTEATNRGSANDARTFSILRFLILVVAGINFMNLSIARGSTRSKEVGIRKVLGAQRTHLTRQFLFESVSYCIIALAVSLVLVLSVSPILRTLVGLEALRSGFFSASILGQSVLFAILLGLVTGIYPALDLSRARPVKQVQKSIPRTGSFLPRNAFVLVQFVISMILVAGTMIVLTQLNFIQNRDTGFNPEQLIVLQTDDTAIQSQFTAFRTEVERHPAIISTAGSNAVPGSPTMTFGILPEGMDSDSEYSANIVRIDDHALFDTYEFELVEGRFFDENRPTDAVKGIVINEALLKSIGWQEAVGRRLAIPGELDEGEVIGVVRDFNFQSMHLAIAPLAFYFAPRGEFLSVRIASGSMPEALDHLKNTWSEFETRYPFTYSFLDEGFARYYEVEIRLMRLLSIFAVLAIFIACLGLYGLAALITASRTKEIGIRKVVGATLPQIVWLFVFDLVRLVGLAIVVGTPIVYLGAQKWLEGFAYRAPMGLTPYLVAAAIVLGIALLSVSYQPIRAARSNPVKALRYE